MNTPNILILGTDAAGKNYLGQLLFQKIRATGMPCAFRERRLSAADNGGEEKDKSAISHLAERVFISAYPLLSPILPYVVNGLITLDLALLKATHHSQIIVSHNALRLAAFNLGHKYQNEDDLVVPSATERLLKQLKSALNGDVVVLDVSHETRLKRVKKRGESSDAFDDYLTTRPELSERIEAYMIHLACTYLDASLIENNDLEEHELLTAVGKASNHFDRLLKQ